MTLLTICIPTVEGRHEQFDNLIFKLRNQHDSVSTSDVEILSYKDNKEISIGEKRNRLYNYAQGLFTVMLDDDDDIPDDYISTTIEAIKSNPDVDCIGYVERCVINGVTQYSKISNIYPEWATPNNDSQFNYHRTPFFKVPIKTELCKQVGVANLRFGEDHDFAKRIKPLLKTETFIDKVMYYYTANSLTPEQHKERYGIL